MHREKGIPGKCQGQEWDRTVPARGTGAESGGGCGFVWHRKGFGSSQKSLAAVPGLGVTKAGCHQNWVSPGQDVTSAGWHHIWVSPRLGITEAGCH